MSRNFVKYNSTLYLTQKERANVPYFIQKERASVPYFTQKENANVPKGLSQNFASDITQI